MGQQQPWVNNCLWIGAGVLVGWSTAKYATWARRQVVQRIWPMGPLRLTRPLVTFDIESTGTNVTRDRIVEIAAIKLMPNGTLQVLGPQRFNPGVPMSAEVTAIHGIRDADVAHCPRFGEAAAEWRNFLQDCDLHGYNAKKFDVPILRNEFKRAGILNFPPLGVTVVDSFRLFCMQEPRSLGAAVAFYCGRSHAGAAHTALADAQATLAVLVEQLRRYPQLPRDADALSALCAAPSRAQDITGDSKFRWRGDTPVMAFGKYAGEPLAVMIARHKDHLRWMSGQDFSDESLILVGQALKGLLPTKAGGWEPLDFGPEPQQQQQQRSGGSSSSSSSRVRSSGRAQESEQQQLAPDAAASSSREQAQGTVSGSSKDGPHAACSTAATGGGGSGPHPAAAAAVGWPALDNSSASTMQATDNPDSWAGPAATPATAAVTAAAGAAEEEEEAREEGFSSPGSGNGSPDSWSIVDPSPQDVTPGVLNDLSNPEPQQPEQDAGEQEQQQQLG